MKYVTSMPAETPTVDEGPTPPQIWCDGLVKIYKLADLEVVALQGLDLQVQRGEVAAIVGASGSGKSTLLNILGGLDTPSAGTARVAGHDLLGMRAAERTGYRREVVGFVWQQTTRNLVPYLSAAENVELPMVFAGRRRRERRERAKELLGLVGLAERVDHRPAELSGGEQQRVAVATALANEPEVLLADEPTGELDSRSSDEVFGVIRHAGEALGVTALVLTHDPQVSEQVQRTIAIRDGRISSETLRRHHVDGDVIAEEFAVLDRAGRMQLPAEYIDALALERRVRLELESDHVGVWPDRPRADGAEVDE